MVRLLGLVGALTLAVACEAVGRCDEYVDYMCACHGDDTGVDCAALVTTYEDADPAVQDECAVLLDEQKAEDGTCESAP